MVNKRVASLVAASAVVALAAALPARAQMMAPPAPMMAPVPQMPVQMMPPMQPPGGLDIYSYSDAPQAEPGDSPANWSARQNVVESHRYDQLTRTNPAFRQARIRKECGSINEPDLYQQCVATFY